MTKLMGLAALALLAACGREAPDPGRAAADSTAAAPTVDSAPLPAPPDAASPADSVMARDTAQPM